VRKWFVAVALALSLVGSAPALVGINPCPSCWIYGDEPPPAPKVVAQSGPGCADPGYDCPEHPLCPNCWTLADAPPGWSERGHVLCERPITRDCLMSLPVCPNCWG